MTWSEQARKAKEAAEHAREQAYWNARDRGETPPIPASLLIKAGKGLNMTCKLAAKAKGEPAPRTCPKCGISGKCQDGYEYNVQAGGYVLVCPDGTHVFYDIEGNVMNVVEPAKPSSFPPPPPEKLHRVIETRRRLGLIGYLLTLKDVDKKSVGQLDNIVDEITAILLD